MTVFGICQFFGRWYGDFKNGRYSVFQSPNGDGKIQFLIENTTVAVFRQIFDYGITVIFEKINSKEKKIDYLFSVTWSKTMCGMRIYLFILYFGSKDDLECAHVFIFTNLRLY